MAQIELSSTKGEIRTVLVDDADYEFLSAYKWHYNSGYATRQIEWDKDTNRCRKLYMHRFLTNAKPGMYVDHINRNKLDNRRANLRLCNQSQNCANSVRPPSLTGYRGVKLDKRDGRYSATVFFRGRAIALGRFATAEEAAEVYNKAAIEYFGDFARPNLIRK